MSNKLMQKIFCDRGKHWNYNILNEYEECRFCGKKHYFTTVEHWALRRDLPARPTLSYKIGEWVGGLFAGTVTSGIVIVSFVASLMPCIALFLLVIWLIRHW